MLDRIILFGGIIVCSVFILVGWNVFTVLIAFFLYALWKIITFFRPTPLVKRIAFILIMFLLGLSIGSFLGWLPDYWLHETYVSQLTLPAGFGLGAVFMSASILLAFWKK